jgi:hypothetical protein
MLRVYIKQSILPHPFILISYARDILLKVLDVLDYFIRCKKLRNFKKWYERKFELRRQEKYDS